MSSGFKKPERDCKSKISISFSLSKYCELYKGINNSTLINIKIEINEKRRANQNHYWNEKLSRLTEFVSRCKHCHANHRLVNYYRVFFDIRYTSNIKLTFYKLSITILPSVSEGHHNTNIEKFGHSKKLFFN